MGLVPSSPDPIGGNELQAAGENLATWGAPKLNQVITNLAFMIAGRTTYACNGSYTPTTTNYVANEFRAFIHDVTGTGGAVTMPARPFVKLFRNQCAGSITVACGGASATLAAGRTSLVWSDGTDCRRFWDNDAGGDKLINVGTPTTNTDAATKKYVDDTAFSSITNLPGQTGNAGKVLGTDGTDASWVLPLPDQTGQAGQYLSTDGTTASWEDIVQVTIANLNTVLATGRIKFNAFTEKAATYTSGAIDTSTGSVFTAAVSGTTTISLSNLPGSPATGDCVTINGEIVITGTPTITWPAGILWTNTFTISAGTWSLTIKARWTGSAWAYVGSMVKLA